MFLDQPGIEAIMSCGYGSVRGEYDFPGDPRNRGIEGDAFVFHAHADRFQHRKSAVAFVEMKDAGRNAESLQSPQSAHTKEQFLANTDTQIAAIQAGCKFAVLRSVAFDIGVEQQQVSAA